MKKSSIVADNHNETTIKTDQNENLDHSSDRIQPSNLSPFSPKFLFANQQPSPIPSYAYSFNHISYADKVKESLKISQNDKKSVEITVLSDSIQDPKIFAFKPEAKPNYLSDLNTLTVLKHLRWSRCSILVNAFTDPLTLGIPLFICCILAGLKGLKKLSVCYLMVYLIYLIVSMTPYLLLAVLYWRVEVRVLVGIVMCFKAFNFFVVSWLCFRLAFVSREIKNKVAVDYHTYPGPSCLCC